MKQEFYMPAEFEQHERTFIQWPVKEALCYPENYGEVCDGYAEVANGISEFEKVTVIVNEDSYADAKARCKEEVELWTIEHSDGWFRDNGPTFLWNDQRELKGVNWKFNAWGEKYSPYDADDKVAPTVLEKLGVDILNVDLVLEGGSIHTDGQGTLLTTEECLLNTNRNPQLTREEIEKTVKETLQVSKIVWLKRGLDGDETDGHIDNICCFAKPGVVMLQTTYDPNHPNFEITKENLSILQGATDALGRKLEIVEIPNPPIREYEGSSLTLSYLNFYFVNGGIILPIFGGDASDTDAEAIRILSEYFPERRIKTVDGMRLIKEGGNVHCITQQMPKGRY